MKLLITGANGQVGRELVDLAVKSGNNVLGLGSEDLNICDRFAVFEKVAAYQPTIIINAAAYTAVDKADQDKEKAYEVNCAGVEHITLACKAHDIPLIHISTDYVFDGEKNAPYLESDAARPVSVYGASKYAGENALSAAWEKHIIVRVGWIFGRCGSNFF